MTRPVTARMAQALLDRRPIGLLCEIDHPDGTVRFWTGLGTLTYDGETWIGIGVLGGIAPVKQSSDVSIQEIQYALSGVDTDAVSRISDDVRNRAGSAWLFCLDEQHHVVADPYQVVDSQLDYQTFTAGDGGETAISIIARTGFYTLERGIDEAWTPENQKSLYPTDTGLDMIPGLQNQDVQWTAT